MKRPDENAADTPESPLAEKASGSLQVSKAVKEMRLKRPPEQSITELDSDELSEEVHVHKPVRKGRVKRPGTQGRLKRLLISASIFVGIPTVIAIVYYGHIASNQYAAGANFSIRSQSPAMAGGGLLHAASPLAGMTDLPILEKYILSRQLLEDMKPRLDLRKMYSYPTVNEWARVDPKCTEEEFLKYWQSMVMVSYDPLTGVGEVQVKAFTAQDAKDIADQVLLLSEQLVNHLSERAQMDTVKLAQEGVNQAYDRVIRSVDEMQKYSSSVKQLDPVGYAKSRGDIQGKLESDLLIFQSQLDLLRKDLPDDAPGVKKLKSQIAVIKEQLGNEKNSSTSSQNSESPVKMVAAFEKLDLERTYAEKAYMSSLTSLEGAKAESLQQSRYLEAFVRPQLPEYPEYPQRTRNIIITFLASMAAWAIGSLFISAAKEHI